LECFQNN
jgi:hypothetical protein